MTSITELFDPVEVKVCGRIEIVKQPHSYEIYVDGAKQEGVLSVKIELGATTIPTFALERILL